MTELRLFKFVTTLDLVDNIEYDNKKKHETFCSLSKAETIINERDIDDVFNYIKQTKILCKGSFWNIDSVINISNI